MAGSLSSRVASHSTRSPFGSRTQKVAPRFSPFAGGAAHAPVLLHDGTRDREAEASVTALLPCRHLLEGREHPLTIIGRKADPSVVHVETKHVALLAHAQRDGSAVWGELHGVLQEVQKTCVMRTGSPNPRRRPACASNVRWMFFAFTSLATMRTAPSASSCTSHDRARRKSFPLAMRVMSSRSSIRRAFSCTFRQRAGTRSPTACPDSPAPPPSRT